MPFFWVDMNEISGIIRHAVLLAYSSSMGLIKMIFILNVLKYLDVII